MDSLNHISGESSTPQKNNQRAKEDLLKSLEEKREQQNQETPLEFAMRVARESDVDIDYTEKEDIQSSTITLKEIANSLAFDSKSTKVAFDLVASLK